MDALTPAQQKRYEAAPAEMNHAAAMKHATSRTSPNTVSRHGGINTSVPGKGVKHSAQSQAAREKLGFKKETKPAHHQVGAKIEWDSTHKQHFGGGKLITNGPKTITVRNRGTVVGMTPGGKLRVKHNGGYEINVNTKNARPDSGPDAKRSAGSKLGHSVTKPAKANERYLSTFRPKPAAAKKPTSSGGVGPGVTVGRGSKEEKSHIRNVRALYEPRLRKPGIFDGAAGFESARILLRSNGYKGDAPTMPGEFRQALKSVGLDFL